MSPVFSPAHEGNVHLLTQGIELLDALSDCAFTGSLGGHSSVGVQYRHLLEHYQSLLGQWPSGRINYDERPRDTVIEQQRSRALAATRTIIQALQALDRTVDPPLMVHTDAGGGKRPDWRASSLGRELQVLSSHTVHHYALMALLLEGLGESVPSEFGVAPSTLTHQRTG